MSANELSDAASEWARDDVRRGAEEGRTGSLFSVLVPAFVAGAKWAADRSLRSPPEPDSVHQAGALPSTPAATADGSGL